MAACLVPSPGIEPSPPALGNEESELKEVGHLEAPYPGYLSVSASSLSIPISAHPPSIHLHCGKKDRRGGRERPREQLGCSCHHPRSGGGLTCGSRDKSERIQKPLLEGLSECLFVFLQSRSQMRDSTAEGICGASQKKAKWRRAGRLSRERQVAEVKSPSKWSSAERPLEDSGSQGRAVVRVIPRAMTATVLGHV